jgi:hypothetical protein
MLFEHTRREEREGEEEQPRLWRVLSHGILLWMRFLTPSECDAWVSRRGGFEPSPEFLSIHLPAESGRLLFLARYFAHEMTCREPCLLRVTNPDVWGSNNNWHLYYRLRQSYSDRLLIHEAPGHLFLDYEVEDLATFLHVAMLFGWDADLKPEAPYFAAELSHDGFLDVHCDRRNLGQFAEFQKVIEGAKLTAKMRT